MNGVALLTIAVPDLYRCTELAGLNRQICLTNTGILKIVLTKSNALLIALQSCVSESFATL